MRTTMIAALLVAAGAAQSGLGAESRSARKLERAYIEIATVLAESRAADGPCGRDIEAYQDEIVDAARLARSYFDYNNDANQEKGLRFSLPQVVKDQLKDTVALKSIMNMLDFNKPETIATALNRVVMWGPAMGVLGNTSYYTFGPGNKLMFSLRVWEDDDVVTEDSYGHFEVERNSASSARLRLQIEGLVEHYVLSYNYQYKQWILLPDGSPDANPFSDGYTDIPSECEA